MEIKANRSPIRIRSGVLQNFDADFALRINQGMREVILLVADVVVSISLLEILAENDSSKNGGFGNGIARASTQAGDNSCFIAYNYN